MNDKLSANLGYLYENAVAQILTSTGNELFYYTFSNVKQKKNYEIDFILFRKIRFALLKSNHQIIRFILLLMNFMSNFLTEFLIAILFTQKMYLKTKIYYVFHFI